VARARPRITVVGLGPGGDEFLPDAVVAALTADPALSYLRTTRHPSAARFTHAHTFDALYDSAASFDDVYAGIVEALVSAAKAAAPRPVVYAVPGSPVVAERSVELLRADDRIDLTVVPALSFLDLAWDRLRVDPIAAGVQLLDAAEFPDAAWGARGPFLVGQCWSRDLLSRIKLSAADTEQALPRPVILHHLGLGDEAVVAVDWWELDRAVDPDHLTSVFVPVLHAPRSPRAAAAGYEMARLVELMDTLRTECPWDRAQTHATLMPHLVEECYEVLDALAALAALASADAGTTDSASDAAGHLEEELGDLLFQIVFHARLASEEGAFDLGDVARGIHEKLVHRHPHVFGEVEAKTPDVVVSNWEDIKKREKGRRSVTEGIPRSLPALMLSNKLTRKARSVGVEPPSDDEASAAVEAVRALAGRAARAELHPDDPLAHDAVDVGAAVGEILFVVADLAQRLGVDAEQALRARALTLRDDVIAAESVPDQEQDSR
jgi:tetrapyrrole methylase family protein/MazG family protein